MGTLSLGMPKFSFDWGKTNLWHHANRTQVWLGTYTKYNHLLRKGPAADLASARIALWQQRRLRRTRQLVLPTLLRRRFGGGCSGKFYYSQWHHGQWHWVTPRDQLGAVAGTGFQTGNWTAVLLSSKVHVQGRCGFGHGNQDCGHRELFPQPHRPEGQKSGLAPEASKWLHDRRTQAFKVSLTNNRSRHSMQGTGPSNTRNQGGFLLKHARSRTKPQKSDKSKTRSKVVRLAICLVYTTWAPRSRVAFTTRNTLALR